LSNRITEQVFNLFFRKGVVKGNFEFEEIFRSIDRYFFIFDMLSTGIKFSIVIKEKNDRYTMEILADEKNLYKVKNLEIYKLLSKFSETLPKLEFLLDKKSVELEFDELENFILEKKDFIQDLGIKVIIPKNLQKLLKPKLKIYATVKTKNLQSFLELDKLLEYDFFIAIGNEKISIEELNKLLKSGRKIIKFKENYIYLEPKEIENLLKQVEKRKKLNKYDLLHLKFNEEIDLDSSISNYLNNIFTPKSYPLPDLKAKLREYQVKGYQWGLNNLLNGFGVIFADDMGLGKTLQAIAIITYLKNEKLLKNQALIIVPTTLLNNWILEIEKFSPTLSYSLYYGTKRKIDKNKDIILTTYQIMRRDIEKLKKSKFSLILIDEAQNIKNPYSETSISLKKLKAQFKIALSGTPVENNLTELWSIFEFTMPKYLKSLKEFQENFAKKIEINKDKATATRLKNITAPFMIRRLKTDKEIIKDLPEKIVIDQYITLEKEQGILYQSLIDEVMSKLKKSEGIQRSGLIFKLLTGLKQICNHPRNFDKSYSIDAKLSGKTLTLLQLLETILDRNEKVLIFTQYTQMGDILEEIIKKELYVTPLYLKGTLSKTKRDKLIETFNSDDSKKIFILSLKAGGTGLNLTKANNVIHYDLWFNPAVENQATDRAFRIGQKKNVNVFRFITKNTFEEKVDKMLKAKQELQDLTISVGEKWISNLSDEELENLLK